MCLVTGGEYGRRHDTDAPPLPIELERVCRRCLVPSVPSNSKDINVRIVCAVMWTRVYLPSESKKVCESCRLRHDADAPWEEGQRRRGSMAATSFTFSANIVTETLWAFAPGQQRIPC